MPINLKFKFKKNQKLLKALAVLSILVVGLIIAVVLKQTQTFELYSSAAGAKCNADERQDCNKIGCLDGKDKNYKCTWNSKKDRCEKRYNKKICSGGGATGTGRDTKISCGDYASATCILGIDTCSDAGKISRSGNCFQGICCSPKPIKKSCEDRGFVCVKGITSCLDLDPQRLNKTGNCNQGICCSKF